ncbi:thermonuclease family protein [Xanthomonas sp. Kuri4-1]
MIGDLRHAAFRGSAALLLVMAAGPGTAAGLQGRARVTDGDTLTLASSRIRLWGIDAPERAQHCTTRDGQGWPCGRRAAAALDAYVRDRTVRCRSRDTDRYGREVAECFVQGQSVNRWMVRSGWAVAYRQYAKAFIVEEGEARQHRRNLWQGPFELPADYRRRQRTASAGATEAPVPLPGGCRIKGNISRQGKRIYHLPGQRDYAHTRIDAARGERIFCSAGEALRAGWQPAKR